MLFSSFTLVDHTGNILSHEEVTEKVTKLAYCHTDSKGFFVEVNDAYCKLYGYDRSELIGNHFTLVLPEEARATVAQMHTDFINGEDELPQEWTVMRKDGELIQIRTEAVRMQGGGNQPPAKLTIIERI